MRKRWLWTVALAAGVLGFGGNAVAQPPLSFIPNYIGAARIPEPLPLDGPTPNLAPGPLGPLDAPPVPLDKISLPDNHSSAFQCENFPPEEHCYLNLGAQGLIRQKPGQGGIAVLDPQNLDTGISPPPGQPVIQRFNDINQNMNFGPKVTVGYLFNDTESIEFTGFYIFNAYNSVEADHPGQVDAFFNNAPLGFEGDNGMWLQADKLRTEFSTRLASGELNYRYANKALIEAEFIFGLRYVDQKEGLTIYTGDDDLTVIGLNGQPDPTRQATYSIGTENRMICPQFGFEYGKACTPYFTFGITGKAAYGVNLIQVETELQRGDGYVGFHTYRNEASFGQIYDVGAFVDFNILERLRLRAGYNAMWLLGVATAVDNLDFNLTNTTGNRTNYGNIFYQGPSLELQFLF